MPSSLRYWGCDKPLRAAIVQEYFQRFRSVRALLQSEAAARFQSEMVPESFGCSYFSFHWKVIIPGPTNATNKPAKSGRPSRSVGSAASAGSGKARLRPDRGTRDRQARGIDTGWKLTLPEAAPHFYFLCSSRLW